MNGGDRTMIHTGDADAPGGALPAGTFMSVEVIEGPDRGMAVTLSKTRAVFGRGQDADVRLNDQTVSGKHAVLEFNAEDSIFIVDQNSSNGTFINGQKVGRAQVGNMSEIQLGGSKILLSVVRDIYGAYAQQAQGGQHFQMAPMVDTQAETKIRRTINNPPLANNVRILLYLLDGPEAGKKLFLAKQSTVLGRGDRADLKINDEAASRRHCQIIVNAQNALGIKDLASSNGTLVNGRPINAVKLNHNDVVQVGDTRIRIYILQEQA